MTHGLQPARTVSALRRAGLAAALSVTTLATFTAVTALTALTLPTAAFAAGGTSGPKVQYQSQGHLGTVIVNPYKIAPLTAIVKNGGYVVKTPRCASFRNRAASSSPTLWASGSSSPTGACPSSASFRIT